LPRLITSPRAAAAHAALASAQQQQQQSQRKQLQILARAQEAAQQHQDQKQSQQQQRQPQLLRPSLRKVASLMSRSGEDADSEPSTGDCGAGSAGISTDGSSFAAHMTSPAMRGTSAIHAAAAHRIGGAVSHGALSVGGSSNGLMIAAPPLAPLGPHGRPKSHSIDVLSGAAEDPLFGDERLQQAAQQPQQAPQPPQHQSQQHPHVHFQGEPARPFSTSAVEISSSAGAAQEDDGDSLMRRWKVSTSSLNLLLSKQLFTQFQSEARTTTMATAAATAAGDDHHEHVTDDEAHFREELYAAGRGGGGGEGEERGGGARPRSDSAASTHDGFSISAFSMIPARPPRALHWLKRALSPWVPLSPRAVFGYLSLSALMYRLVTKAHAPVRRHSTMLTFAPPMIAREAPQLVAGLVLFGIARTAWAQRKSFGFSIANGGALLSSASLCASWLLNVLALGKLANMFRSLVRDAAPPFRAAMAEARIPMPSKLPQSQQQESALTNIAPADSHSTAVAFSNNAASALPAVAAGFVEASSRAHQPQAEPQQSQQEQLPALAALPASGRRAYSRLGRMGFLRWVLSFVQLTTPLAWAEGITWETGVVFETLHARDKTRTLKLDLYRPKYHNNKSKEASNETPSAPLPIFLYLHGGGWLTGHRSFHSLSLLYAMAKAGFLVCSINYRLSPFIKHPTHVMDCKRALVWLRRHAAALGADPSFVLVGGESAGAHLACLLGLTPNNASLQPGEGCDTRVQGVVDLYGPHDFLDEHYHFRAKEDPHAWLGGFGDFLNLFVMGESARDAEGVYAMASPLHRLRHFEGGGVGSGHNHHSQQGSNDGSGKGDSGMHGQQSPRPRMTAAHELPPFFGAHGTRDDLIPLGDSDAFYRALHAKRAQFAEQHAREQAEYEQRMLEWAAECAMVAAGTRGHLLPAPPPRPQPPVPLPPCMDVYVRVEGASHAFNNVLSPRAFALNDSVTAWAVALYDMHHQRRRQHQPQQQETEQLPIQLSSRL
jgi:acetyl esterase/lipase